MATIELVNEYVTVCCGGADKGGCDVQFAMTRSFYDMTMRTKRGWYCPNGHRRYWSGPSPDEKLQRAEAQLSAQRDQLEAAVREAETIRTALLRDRQRFANGVCPCCNRSFENVRRHMTTKHPDYDATRFASPPSVRFSCSCGSSFETLHGLRIHQGHMRGEGWARPGASRWSAHLTKV